MPFDRNDLEHFGEALVRKVYDEAFAHLRRVLGGEMRGRRRVELAQLYKSLDSRSAEITRRFMAEAVDATLSHFLEFFDEHDIPLYFYRDDGELVEVRSLSAGLAAEPYTDAGWIEKYSVFKDRIDPLK